MPGSEIRGFRLDKSIGRGWKWCRHGDREAIEVAIGNASAAEEYLAIAIKDHGARSESYIAGEQVT